MANRAGVVSVDVEPNLGSIPGKLDALARGLRPLGVKVDLLGDFASKIDRDAQASRRSLDGITTTKAQGELRALGSTGERELGRLGSASRLSSEALLTVGAGSVFAGTRILGALRPATDAASSLNETVAYSEQVFGSSAKAIDKWSDTAADALGQSKRAATDGANTFATFGKAAGLAGNDLVGFSTDLVQLATDLASAKDTTPAEAITALGAALRGETEPIRQYGVLLDDASIRQEALALGITKTTKDALTPQQKVLAVNSLLFKQTGDAQGDFARTGDSLANVQRKQAAAAEDARAKLGEGLLPVVAAGTKTLTAFLGVLDKIPGATTALGIGAAVVGAGAIVGGGITTILGAVKAVREFSAGSAAAGAVAATANTTTAATATEAAVATAGVTAAMESVVASAAAAGAAGTAAMAGIAASATAASAATSSVGGFQFARTRAPALTASTGALDVIDVTSREVPALSAGPKLLELGSGARAAAAATEATVGPVSRLGGAVKGLSSSVTGAVGSARTWVGSIPPVTAGLAAATVAVVGFSSAWSQLQEQTAEGASALAIDPGEIAASFDPTVPERFKVTVDDIAASLAELNHVGDLNAWDRIFPFDEGGSRAEVAVAQIESLTTAVESMPTDQARQFVDAVDAALVDTPIKSDAARLAWEELKQSLSDREAADRASGSLNDLGGDLTRLGVKIDESASKWDNYSTVLGGITTPGIAAMNAAEAWDDGLRAVTDAQRRLDDIVNGNTEGLRSAVLGLNEAKDALNEAVADTGPGSRAARDAAGEVRDALRAYRELQIEAGKTAPGDWIEDRTADLQDAYDRILDAQDKLREAESGNSDEVVAARDRVAEAERRVAEERGKTGANSEDARQAAEDLSDAEQNLFPLLTAKLDAEAQFQEQLEEHPEAVQATIDLLDDAVEKGLINAAVAEEIKKKYLEAAAAAKEFSDSLPSGAPTVWNPFEGWQVGGGAPKEPAKPKKADNPKIITITEGKAIGLPADPAPFAADGDKPAPFVWDNQDRPWVWSAGSKRWIAKFAMGGPVLGFGSGDIVPALLEPGEFVVKKSKVKEIGLSRLSSWNNSTKLPDPGPGERSSGAFLHSGDREHAVMPPQDGTREHAVMPLDALTAEVRALRGELVSTVRYLARTVTPGAGEELAPVLREIERNTRNAAAGDTPSAVRSKAMANV